MRSCALFFAFYLLALVSMSPVTVHAQSDENQNPSTGCDFFDYDCEKKLYGSDDGAKKASTDDDVKTTTHQKAIEPDEPWGKKKTVHGDIIGKHLETR